MCSDILLIIIFWCLLKYYSYQKGYEDGDHDGCERFLKNQICIDCKSLDNCKNPDGYNGRGYCRWEP